jgi:hypothetical protein
MKHKLLNGLCVPISTPDDYFTTSAKRWLSNLRLLQQAGRNVRESNLQQIEARYELENDEFETARDKAIRIASNLTRQATNTATLSTKPN